MIWCILICGMYAMMCVCVEATEELCGVRSLLPPYEFQAPNSGGHASWQVPFLAEPPCRPCVQRILRQGLVVIFCLCYKKKNKACLRIRVWSEPLVSHRGQAVGAHL